MLFGNWLWQSPPQPQPPPPPPPPPVSPASLPDEDCVVEQEAEKFIQCEQCILRDMEIDELRSLVYVRDMRINTLEKEIETIHGHNNRPCSLMDELGKAEGVLTQIAKNLRSEADVADATSSDIHCKLIEHSVHMYLQSDYKSYS